MDFLLAWNNDAQSADWAFDGNDLVTDDSLRSAVVISLGTDRLAEATDVIPDGSNNRRGWWGDMPLDGQAAAGKPDLIGSRLWLLRRATQTERTERLAEQYCREALAWLIEDGVAAKVDVSARWLDRGYLGATIGIYRTAGAAQPDHTFDFAWSAL